MISFLLVDDSRGGASVGVDPAVAAESAVRSIETGRCFPQTARHRQHSAETQRVSDITYRHLRRGQLATDTPPRDNKSLATTLHKTNPVLMYRWKAPLEVIRRFHPPICSRRAASPWLYLPLHNVTRQVWLLDDLQPRPSGLRAIVAGLAVTSHVPVLLRKRGAQ